MRSREKYEFTPVRIAFWIIMAAVLGSVACLWTFARPAYYRNSDKAYCIMNQRNLQQAVRSYANMEGLKPGDPLDWSKIIGPGLFLETKPACPVHGDYVLSPVLPEPGTLAAPCQDPKHRPADTEDW